MNEIILKSENFGHVYIVLKELINGRKIARNELAEKTGINYNAIDRYYKFDKKPISSIDLVNLAKICYVLDCEVSDILKYEKPE